MRISSVNMLIFCQLWLLFQYLTLTFDLKMTLEMSDVCGKVVLISHAHHFHYYQDNPWIMMTEGLDFDILPNFG